MERRNGYDKDIRWDYVFASCVVGLIIGIVILLIGLFFTWSSAGFRVDSWESHTRYVERFNALDSDKRLFLIEWQYLSDSVDANNFMVCDPQPPSVDTCLKKAAVWLFVAMLVCVSTGTFCSYFDEKSHRFFCADYPFSGTRSRVAFVLMWLYWPVLLVSRLRMRRWEAQQKAEQTVANEEANQEPEVHNEQDKNVQEEREEEEGNDEDEDESITYEDLSADLTDFDNDSCEQFIAYCQDENQHTYKERLSDAEEKVKNTETSLRDYGQRIQKLQGELKEAKLELEKLKSTKPPEPKDLKVLKTEWEAIKSMRGVTNIYYDEYDETLCIDVAVRVPYEGETYDFGDYTIQICHDEIECPRSRSGVRDDWRAGSYPDYCYSDGTFCLGNRERSISKFIVEQRFREAIILIIDCMHSVNDEEEAANIPKCFRRIVPPKEG